MLLGRVEQRESLGNPYGTYGTQAAMRRAIRFLLPVLLICLVALAAPFLSSLDRKVDLPYPPLDCGSDAPDAIRQVALDALLVDAVAGGCSGRRLRVKGFLILEFENNGLYVSREVVRRMRMGLGDYSLPQGVGVVTSGEPRLQRWFNQHNVIVDGTFYLRVGDSPSEFGWRGEIRDVVKIDYQTVQDMALPVPLVPAPFFMLDPRTGRHESPFR